MKFVSANKGGVNIPLLVVGSVMYGAALGLLLSPNRLAPGGISGLAVIISSVLPVGVGTLTVALNIPMLILGRVYFGRSFLVSTLLAILISGTAADICMLAKPLTVQPFPCAAAGGFLIGAGCGLVFRAGGTTGGTDIAAKIVKRHRPYLQTGQIFLMIDGTVCILSGVVSGSFDNAMYSFFALAVFTKTLDFVLYGPDEAKSAFIMSFESEKVKEALLKYAGVGCTALYGKSGYTGRDLQVLVCGVTKRRLPEVIDAVLTADSKAFMLVGNATEIYGEGFKKDNKGYF